MRYSRQFVGLISVVAVFGALALAQESRAERSDAMQGSLPAARNIRIKVDMGAVTVHGGQQPNITYVLHSHSFASDQGGGNRSGSFKINAYTKGDTAWIVAEWEGRRPHRFSGEFVIDLPRNTDSVKIQTGGGAVQAMGITGQVGIGSGGGKVQLDDIGGSVDVETGGDSIDIGTVGGDLKLETGGGNISIKSAKGQIKAETGGGNVLVMSGDSAAQVEAGGGNVEIRHCGGGIKASTGGGNITLGDIGGPAQVSTGGGSIRLASARGRVGANSGAGSIELFGVPSAKVETGAGAITVKFINNGGDHSDSMLETSAGDITVYVAPNVKLSVRASVDMGNGHRINSDFADIHIASEGDTWGPRSLNAEGNLNGGGPVLKVRTTTGDICFRKANQ